MKLPPKIRKQQILETAVVVLKDAGLEGLTREAVATKAAIATGTVSLHFKTMKQLRRAVARKAMATMDGAALAKLLSNDTYTKMLKPEHVEAAVAHLTG